MKTKIEAARSRSPPARTWSSPAARCSNPLRAIGDGAPCTWFLAHSDPVTARKRWIAGQLEPKGHVYVDAGAEKALAAGKSLLPAGVARVEGAFERGDAVIIRAADGRELGRGLIAYASGGRGAYHRQEEQRDRRHPGRVAAATS